MLSRGMLTVCEVRATFEAIATFTAITTFEAQDEA
jgi:hypothetical protein